MMPIERVNTSSRLLKEMKDEWRGITVWEYRNEIQDLITFAEEAQKKIAVLDSPERWIMWCDEKMLTLNKELQAKIAPLEGELSRFKDMYKQAELEVEKLRAKIAQQTHDHEILVNSILEEKNKKIAELEDNHKVLTLLKEKNAKIAELEKQIQGQFKND